jgi:glutathione peroxidase
MDTSLWQIDLKSTIGGIYSRYQFWDKPIVIFNSASLCGFTNQLNEFETLYQSSKIVPIAIPTDNFGGQEPGDTLEIHQHYKKKYKVTYPILDKATLEHGFFKLFGTPDWNFNKWLFDRKHVFVRRFDSKTTPADLLDYV